MTIVNFLTLVFLFCVLSSLIFLFLIIEYKEIKYKNPTYLMQKISEKERLLSIMISEFNKKGFDFDRAAEIEHIRSEICELYTYLEKATVKVNTSHY